MPATKIWCPKCHKRHRLPANAGGMTLRCRGCQFAFRVQDGLMQDPGGEVILLGEDDAVSPTGPSVVSSEPAHYASTEVFPVDDSSSAVIPARTDSVPASPVAVTEESPEALSLDNDFDDILDVLDSPVSEPSAPPVRAHAKSPQESTMVPYAGGVVAATGAPAPAAQSETVQRNPVSRSQLRAHRNSRQFWMLMSLLFACVLGTVSWFAVNLFLKPTLSNWERKMLYAMGTPARWLPPHEGEGDPLLPTDHVKLRGDHVELADRDDKFRDDFFGLPPENEGDDRKEMAFAKNDRDRDEGRDNQRNILRDRRNRAADPPVEDPRRQAGPQRAQMNQRDVVPPRNRRQERNRIANNNAAGQQQNRQPANRNQVRVGNGIQSGMLNRSLTDGVPAPRVGANRNGAVRRRPGRNRVAAQPKVNWTPPAISEDEMQLAMTRGIDPKTIKSLNVPVDASMHVALAGDTVFSIAPGNRFTALDGVLNEVLDSRKLDRTVASICPAASGGSMNRPSAWVLYENGQLEKWQVLNGELNQLTSLQLKPVFKEKRPVIASAANYVATYVAGKVLIAEVGDSGTMRSTDNVAVDGPVSTLRFSNDGSQLMAVIGEQAVLIDVADGAIESRTPLKGLPKAASQSISADLSKLFVVRNGVIDSINLATGTPNGKYWANAPLPLSGVVTENNKVMGFSQGPDSHAVLFGISEMEQVSAPANVAGTVDDSSLLKEGGADAGARQVHELSRSPKFAGKILAVQALPDKRMAFLSDENGRRRIGVATWAGDWKVTPLVLAEGMAIKGFHMSDDLSKVAIFDQDIIQLWTIEDVDSGAAKFVSESVVHTENLSRVMLSNDGAYVVSGDVKGNVYVSSFDTGKRTGGVRGFNSDIVDITAKGPEGFVVMDRRGIANGSSKTTRDKITPFNTTVTGAATLSANGHRIAYFRGSEVQVADVHSHKIVGTFKPKLRPQSIRFSQQQKYLLVQDDRMVSVWDWRKNERVRVFRYPARPFDTKAAVSVCDDDAAVIVVTGEGQNQISIFELPE